jgi:hypothetical protein
MPACRYCGVDLEAPIGNRWAFLIPMDAPTQNVIAQNKGGKRWAYKRMRDDFTLMIMACTRSIAIPAAKRKRRVVITRRYDGRKQERDFGNLVGGLKMVVDAMVHAKLLVDDSPQWVEDFYRQERAVTDIGLLVLLEDLV